jgi:predicted ATPase
MALTAKPYLREIFIDPQAEIDRDRYPFNIPAVAELSAPMTLHADVTFLVGENGAGKSTVLEAIAVGMGLPAEGGTRNVSRVQQAVSPLHECLKLVKGFRRPQSAYFLRAESLFNVISYIDEIDPGRPSLHARSHGEAFMDVMLDLRPGGLYLLDEPEAALSPHRQLAALSAIHQLVQQDCQFIIATHSPILLAYPGAKILQFDASGITEVAYEDTEHFAVTRDFLNHYERRLQLLLADD